LHIEKEAEDSSQYDKNEMFNGEWTTRKPHHRRQNVVRDIRTTGSSFISINNKMVILITSKNAQENLSVFDVLF
jgi:hypothetical protein